ncbi:MAG TPA: SigB/SigF/SigG family RNA polymerase sigma factor [Solirubrobacteraceae bacterium]|nr:SigB/SigF/SigG family RNA polymerase sigma factor [Solirubrobacteraceae bacterium]
MEVALSSAANSAASTSAKPPAKKSRSDRPSLPPPVRRGRLAAAGADRRAARDAEDRELIRRCQQEGSPHVRAQTVEAFMPLARSLARRYHRGEEPLEDLEQVAALGLLKAIDGFDPDRGSAFASFAVPTIVGELRRHFRDKGWGVRVPRDLQELALAVQRKADAMSTEIGRPPTAEELAGKLGRDVEDVLEAREALRAMRPASLDRPASADEDEDDMPLARIGGIDPAYERTEEAVTIGRLVRGLPERERKILALRFGGDLTQSEIGERLGISQMHVSRLLRRTIEELQEQARPAA